MNSMEDAFDSTGEQV